MIRPFFYFFFFFLPRCMACKILVPWPGIEPGPWQWKCWVLITRPSGNFQDIFNGYFKLSFESHKNKTFDNHFCEPCDLQSPLSKKILKHRFWMTTNAWYFWKLPSSTLCCSLHCIHRSGINKCDLCAYIALLLISQTLLLNWLIRSRI